MGGGGIPPKTTSPLLTDLVPHIPARPLSLLSQPHMLVLYTLLMLIGYASNISVLLFFFFFKLIKLRKDKKDPTAKTTFDQNKQFRQKNAFNELYV